MLYPDPVALPADFAAARQSFVTRRIPPAAMRTLLPGPRRPQAGQLVLARIVAAGQHAGVELTTGRKTQLYPDDLAILAYGNRYAPDQFEALVPLDLGPCHMVAGGGIAAREVARHAAMRAPTRIRPLGILAQDGGRPLNVADFALAPAPEPARSAPVFVVAGSSMNAGKTHTAAMLIRGLRALGRRVAGCKATGTGSGGDLWRLQDAGAEPVLDFVDAGFATTFRAPLPAVERAFGLLADAAAAAGADAVVIEIADGLGQRETIGLLRSETLRRRCTAVLFASADPLSAASGVRWLRSLELPVAAVGGVVTANPTAVREAAALVDVPVLTAEQLARGPAIVAAALEGLPRAA